jgi:hypothetical protein
MKKSGGIMMVHDRVQAVGLKAGGKADLAEGIEGAHAVDEADRSRLDAALTAAKEDLARGDVVPLEQVLAEL